MEYLIGIILACVLVVYIRVRPLLKRKRRLEKIREQRRKKQG